MKSRQSDPDLRRHPIYWMFHFGFHFIMSLAAFGAGLMLIFGDAQMAPGLALCGAALFALINGLGGFWELTGKLKKRKYLREDDGR